MKSFMIFTVVSFFNISIFAQVRTTTTAPSDSAAPAPAPALAPAADAGPFGQQKVDQVPGSKILFTAYKIPAGSATQFFLDQAVFAEKTIGEAQGEDIRKKDPVL